MIEIEAGQFAVAHKIDARLFLRVNDDARRIEQRLLGGQRRQPFGKRVGANHCRLDTRFQSHFLLIASLAWYRDHDLSIQLVTYSLAA